MLLPRELAKYAQQSSLDPFAPNAAEALRADPAAASLLREAARSGSDVRSILLALQSLRVAGSGTGARATAEFVATVPPGTPCPARPTMVVMREMLSGPHREVVALGYEISDATFMATLHEVALQCPRMILLCDRGKGSAEKLKTGWPRDRHQPEIHENVAVASPPLSSMHCKTLLVDGEDLLVTSANFTFHGLNGNIEFGVRLRGSAADGARTVLHDLLRSGLFRKTDTTRQGDANA